VELPITLGQFLKAAGLAMTGGEAKVLILGGAVVVNGAVELRRGTKLAVGDVVEIADERVKVVARGSASAGSVTERP